MSDDSYMVNPDLAIKDDDLYRIRMENTTMTTSTTEMSSKPRGKNRCERRLEIPRVTPTIELVENEQEVEEVPARKKGVGKKRLEWVERDKQGKIIRMCGIDGCEHKNGDTTKMKKHKASKHGINMVWFSCGEDNCDYKAKHKYTSKRHKQNFHDIGVVWHHCDSCEYKAKEACTLKKHE